MTNFNDVIVEWAKLNEWIPIRCSECGALFITQNNQYEGAKPVQYAIDYALDPDAEKAKELSYAKARKCNHDKGCWKPDYETFKGGKW